MSLGYGLQVTFYFSSSDYIAETGDGASQKYLTVDRL